MSRDFNKIRAWELADKLTQEVYKLTSRFPATEKFGLVSQMRRAAFSIPANIAEGSNRASKKEYLQFLSIASGSIAELKYSLYLSRRLEYVQDYQFATTMVLAEETSKTLAGLISSIRKEVLGLMPKL